MDVVAFRGSKRGERETKAKTSRRSIFDFDYGIAGQSFPLINKKRFCILLVRTLFIKFAIGIVNLLTVSFSKMASQQEVVQISPSVQVQARKSLSSFYCLTEALVTEVDFEWTIERFAFLSEYGIGRFTSTMFDNNFQLCLRRENASVSYRQLEIDLLSLISCDYSMRVEIVIYDEKKKQLFKDKKIVLEKNKFPVKVFQVRENELLKSGDFVNGEIIIGCKIEKLHRKQPMGMAITSKRKRIDDETSSAINPILKEVEEMFENKYLSDVTFNIGKQQFPAHKIILAMRSPVFKAMYKHSTKEEISGQVEVVDIDPDVFKEVLRFIYTGRTNPTAMDRMAPALLAAADKYLLEDLKNQCETHLILHMSAMNCLKLMSFTTHHPAEHLKKCAIDYFRRYPDDVMKSDSWKKMKLENPAVLFDMLQMILSTAPIV